MGSWGENYRHGGDEFCVVAPETDRDEAEDLDTLLARADERLRVSKEEKPGLSRSAF